MDSLDEWASLTQEEPLEPGLPICDPHHHLWQRPGNRYLVKDMLRDIDGNNVTQTVFVNYRAVPDPKVPKEMLPVRETELIQKLTRHSAEGMSGNPRIATGIVGGVNLSLGEAVKPVLEAHLAAGNGRFRGVRDLTAWDASPEVWQGKNAPHALLDNKFREGFACLLQYGLCYDVWAFSPQLEEVADLANAFPDTAVIVDHTGTPLGIGPYAGKREEVYREWQAGIVAMAKCENIFMKLGGLGMPISGFGWNLRRVPPDSAELSKTNEPYYLFCIEKFGPDRCMFESNFPPDKASGSYTVIWNSFKRMTQGFSAGERAKLFHDTAVRVYRLKK